MKVYVFIDYMLRVEPILMIVDIGMANLQISPFKSKRLAPLSNGRGEDIVRISIIINSFDGDTATIKSPYTEEANSELEELMNSKLNYIDLGASNIKSSSGDSIQAIYSLTKILPDDANKIINPEF